MFKKVVLVWQDYYLTENTVKRIDQPRNTSRRYFQIKLNVSYIELYTDRLEIDYLEHWQII